MSGQYGILYLVLGICVAVLVLSAYRLYRQHLAGLKHSGSLQRTRKHSRRSQREAP